MGAKQSSSPRKLIIPNEGNTGVIKVSDSVVQRMKGSVDDGRQDEPSGTNDVRKPQVATSQQADNVPSSTPVYYTPLLTSLQIQQEKEAELRKNDQYWEQRLAKLQDSHRNVNKILEEEYDKAVKEVSDRFQNFNKSSTPPCQEMKGCVVECYKLYPKNTLACSTAVQAFSDCVDASRMKAIARG